MPPTLYDPQKAHQYYEKTKELKGRLKGHKHPGAGSPSSGAHFPSSPDPATQQAKMAGIAKVGRLKAKVVALEGALTKAKTALTAKRLAERKTAKKNSDGKTTVKERQSAKEYRDKNRGKLAEKEADRRQSKGSSSSSSSEPSSMSSDELETRVANITAALRVARTQLSVATQSLGQLSHSALSAELQLSTQKLHPEISRKESVAMTDADFGGYATRSDIQCADGRTILPRAFSEQDGTYVPLVYQHGHTDINNILGHCLLEARDDGVYAHAFFNDTAAGKTAKMQVQHGDLKFLSIFANELSEKVKDRARGLRDVINGKIKEVSLVIAGANPGAVIDQVNLAHGADGEMYLDEAIITSGIEIVLAHANATATVLENVDEDTTIADVLATLTPEQEVAVNYLLSEAAQETAAAATAQHSETGGEPVGGDANTETGTDAGTGTDNESGTETGTDTGTDAGAETGTDTDTDTETGTDTGDGTDAATETGTDVVTETGTDAGEVAAEGAETGTETGTDAGGDVQHDNMTQEDNSMSQMTHNVFDRNKNGQTAGRPSATLSHDSLNEIVRNAKKNGSLKDAIEDFIAHTGVEVDGTLQHGIENIEYLFPDAQTLESSPAFISRRMEWVDKVLSAVRKSPFSRIKTITADITPDEARARGYIKGNMKNEEFFALSKRETTPQTVYKKQKLDRDDVIDITTLDVVAWLKAEMKVMLDEEIAGAILVGDGRSIGDEDKIKESNIRPIATDADLYATTVNVNLDDASSSIEELVDAAINNRKYYKGSGTPTFYTTEGIIAKFLTVKDNFGRRIYANLAEVAAVLRVAEVVPVEIMERDATLVGIMVNLSDYTLGADRGGQATMFDDFDIDYNKLRYLIETRLSGALTQPKAALVFREQAGANVQLAQPAEPTFAANVVTVPTVTSVTYKNAETNATLVTGTPITLTEGQSLHVIAVPAAGKYFENNAEDEWLYSYEA